METIKLYFSIIVIENGESYHLLVLRLYPQNKSTLIEIIYSLDFSVKFGSTFKPITATMGYI